MNNSLSSDDILREFGDLPDFQDGMREREGIMRVGAELRALRRELVLSKKDATALTGLTVRELQIIETGLGEHAPSADVVARLLEAYTARLRKELKR